MSYGENRYFEQLKLPLTWVVMAIVAGICVLAALVFLGDKRGGAEPASYGNRGGFDSVAAPANNLLSKPAHIVGDGANWLDDYLFEINENRILKKKVAELEKYRANYNQLLELNKRYEKLLKLRAEPPVPSVWARSVSVSRGPFNNNRLIDSGSDMNIRFNNPVSNEHGLVGRVVGVSPKVSRVLMVTDVASRVPVVIARTDARAMLTGDGGGYPRLEFVRGGKDVLKKGDQVLTSGDGGVYPRGIPVGEVVPGVDKVWRVNLYTNRAPIDLVQVMQFEDFSQLPRAEEVLRSPSVMEVLPPPPEPTASQSASSSVTPPLTPAATPARQTTPAPRPAARSATSASASRTAPVPAPVPVPTPATETPASESGD